jgi:Fe-S oxidoreductase/nitrate reductase gamma subunit
MPIRETFWNIPHWAEIAQYILAAVTIIVFLYGVGRRILRWRKGRPEKRTGHFWARLGSVLSQVLAQRRTLDEAYPGIMHFTIFWGMLVLALGTAMATVDWDITHLFFGFQILTGWVYILFELILDILGLLVIVGLGMAIYRRYIVRPSRLQNFPVKNLASDDLYVLIMLLFIAISGYLTEGLRIAVTQPAWAIWSPIGKAIAGTFLALGDPNNQTLHLIIWLLHILTAFVILASLPFTKLIHIFSVPLNIYFRSLEPVGVLPPARTEVGPGVAEWRQFTWKQLLDFESCTRCGRCQDVCPAFAGGGVLSPRDMMVKLEAHLWERKGRSLHGDVIRSEELWACTTCRACSQVCPAFIDHIHTFVDMRRYLVDQGSMDSTLQTALINMGRYGNSFGQSDRMRAKWTANLQPPVKDARREPVEYLWFVGDYASYSPTLADVTRMAYEVFQKASLNVGILYDAERNSGNDVRRVGEEGIFEMLADKNMQVLSKCKYETIITTDPHSYNTLKNEYCFDGNIRPQVLHYTELLDRLIVSGQLTFSRKLDYRVTYHDPCYLGRYNGIYEEPRRLLRATGCTLVEMPRHGDRGFCCGAGGGRIWMEEKPGRERPSEARIREAAGLEGIQAFVVACPKDVTMFRDAIKTTGNENRFLVKELIELVHEAL